MCPELVVYCNQQLPRASWALWLHVAFDMGCWRSGDRRGRAVLLKRGLVALREVKFPAFLLPLPSSPCSVAGCRSPDVFSSENVRSRCTNLSHCHRISISVIT